jgi:hypothetical protein
MGSSAADGINSRILLEMPGTAEIKHENRGGA